MSVRSYPPVPVDDTGTPTRRQTYSRHARRELSEESLDRICAWVEFHDLGSLNVPAGDDPDEVGRIGPE